MASHKAVGESAKRSHEYELDLMNGIAEKDEKSFRALMMLYQDRVKAYASLYAVSINDHVDDIAQDIFLQIYLSAKKFKGDSSVKTWIYSIAKFTINNKLRKKKLLYFWKSWKKTDQSDEALDLISEETPVDVLVTSDNEQNVRSGIESLDVKSKEVIMLYEWSGLSYQQIGQTLGISIGTVKSRLNNARKKLKEHLLIGSYHDVRSEK